MGIEEKRSNGNLRNFIWIVAGILLMAFLVTGATTITDTLISTTGSITVDGDITSDGDILFRGKLDVGQPGVGGGLDVGEGGSYTKNSSGTTIVQAFTYDASASSGSRFTELTLDASNTFLGDPGDRLYVGSTLQFWGARFETTTASSGEDFQILYWNGTDMRAEHYMGLLKNNATSVGQNILEQTAEKEYVIWDHEIQSTWVAADNVVDAVPNGFQDMFWVALNVTEMLSTPPVVAEIKVRGTDFDIVTDAAYLVLWGQARIEKHDSIPLTVAKVPGGVTTTAIDIDRSHQQIVFNFDGAGDNLGFFWTLPAAIDTSSDLHITFDYVADAADTYDLNLTIKRLMNNTLIGSSIVPDFEISTAITAAAADTIYNGVTIGDEIDIQNMSIDDQISFELLRTDDTNAIYPLSVTVHYIAYSTGDHV